MLVYGREDWESSTTGTIRILRQCCCNHSTDHRHQPVLATQRLAGLTQLATLESLAGLPLILLAISQRVVCSFEVCWVIEPSKQRLSNFLSVALTLTFALPPRDHSVDAFGFNLFVVLESRLYVCVFVFCASRRQYYELLPLWRAHVKVSSILNVIIP